MAVIALAADAGFRSLSSRWIDAVGPEARFNAALDGATRDALPAARVVVMGSSRPAFGIQARTLSSDLGYNAEKGVNLAYPSIYGDLLLELYHRAAPMMGNTTILVIGLDDYFLARARGESPRPPIVAPAARPAAQRSSALPTIGLQIPEGIRWLSYRIARAFGIPVVRSTLETWYRSAEGSLLSLGDEDLVLSNPNGQIIADAYFKGKVIDPSLIQPYREILSEARSRGIKVVLVWMPSHPVFDGAIQDAYGPLVEETINAFEALAKEQEASFHAFDAKSCHLQTVDFRDQVHLTPHGASAFTHCLAAYLRSNGM